jgi:NTP pyrophosphatase (non-canonical NTP hydrolase)
MPGKAGEPTPCPDCGQAHPKLKQLTFDYLVESERTCSNDFFGDSIKLSNFIEICSTIAQAIQALDAIKKTAFYGRGLNLVNKNRGLSLIDLRDKLATSIPNDNSKQLATDIIHGIIGKVSEAGELLDLLVKSAVLNNEFDWTNLIEEIGDGLWYDALLLRALEVDFDYVMQLNISKLRARFPDKFDRDKANERDLDSERKVLEGGQVK